VLDHLSGACYRDQRCNGSREDDMLRFSVVISAIEGAIILCRAHHDDKPLDDVLSELVPLLQVRWD
jgi:hypothetical protein